MFGYSANTSFGHDCATLPKNLIRPEMNKVSEDILELHTISDGNNTVYKNKLKKKKVKLSL
jgi:hypothetical protein